MPSQEIRVAGANPCCLEVLPAAREAASDDQNCCTHEISELCRAGKATSCGGRGCGMDWMGRYLLLMLAVLARIIMERTC